MIHNLTIQHDDKTGEWLVSGSPSVAQNRLIMYGFLSMGMELVHRMGDQHAEPNGKAAPKIIIPDLRL